MTVDELLGRMTSREITDWGTFFLLQAEEMERSQKQAGPAGQVDGKREPVMGGAAAAAIEAERKRQGLE